MKRARYLIVTWDGGGNVPPAIALGARLVRSGQSACVLGPEEIAGRVRAADVEFIQYGTVPRVPAGGDLEHNEPLFQELLHGRTVLNEVGEAVDRWKPDVAVVDCMMSAAFAATERCRLTTAVLVHVLYQPFANQWGQFILDAVGPRTDAGLEPLTGAMPLALFDRLALVLALVPAEFDAPIEGLPPNTRYVGPVLDPTPPAYAWDLPWQPGEPMVLVSFSTTWQNQDVGLPPVLEALGRLPVRALLTLGGVPAGGSLTIPTNVSVRDFIPHAAVLPYVSVVITHGGLSTIMASLAAGVPLLCIPQGREQGMNAQRVEAVGAGRHLAAESSPREIAAAVEEILREPRFREGAARMADAIRALGSGDAAVNELLRIS